MGVVRYARECMGVVFGPVRRLSEWKRDGSYGGDVGLVPRVPRGQLAQRRRDRSLGHSGQGRSGPSVLRSGLPPCPQFIPLKAKRPEAGTGGERAERGRRIGTRRGTSKGPKTSPGAERVDKGRLARESVKCYGNNKVQDVRRGCGGYRGDDLRNLRTLRIGNDFTKGS